MLIDTHCHLTFDDLFAQTGAVLQRARAAGVERVINVATNVEDARRAVALLADHPGVYLAAGIHPHEAARTSDDDRAALADLHRGRWADVPAGRLVAIGETGLDFHYDFATPAQQEALFRFHLDLACESGRPVIIHAREAEQRVCEILADYPTLLGRVVFHCYSGGVELTRRILDMGHWLSFTGVVTFRNAETVRQSARIVPDNRLMLETDAPFMSPEPVRKQRPCEPALVVHTARFLAQLREDSFASLAATTTANAVRFFELPEE